MNLKTDLDLPPGTAVYCCPGGLVLDISWQSTHGTHIVRMDLPMALCEPAKRAALKAAVRGFCEAVAWERMRSSPANDADRDDHASNS